LFESKISSLNKNFKIFIFFFKNFIIALQNFISRCFASLSLRSSEEAAKKRKLCYRKTLFTRETKFPRTRTRLAQLSEEAAKRKTKFTRKTKFCEEALKRRNLRFVLLFCCFFLFSLLLLKSLLLPLRCFFSKNFVFRTAALLSRSEAKPRKKAISNTKQGSSKEENAKKSKRK
jgi:hypothetical protein